MPVLNAMRKKIEVKLPKSLGTVHLWEYPLAGEMLGGMTVGANAVNNEIKPLDIITSLIADWDLTDESGTLLPITSENVGLLPIADFTQIANKVQDITASGTVSAEEKKSIKSSSI